jgi:hypothetical protein
MFSGMWLKTTHGHPAVNGLPLGTVAGDFCVQFGLWAKHNPSIPSHKYDTRTVHLIYYSSVTEAPLRTCFNLFHSERLVSSRN